MATTKLTGVLIKTGSIPTTALGGGVISASAQLATSLPTGTVSSSTQIDYNSITNKLSGVVSSSAQVAPLLPGGTVSSSGQVLLNTVSGTTFSNNAFYFPQDLRVEGNLTAQQIYTEYVSSSVIYESGSTKFGDTTDDVMSVTGSIRVLGGSISGSMTGMFSSSAQVDYNSITNKLSGVVSSSAQVQPLLPGGTVSSSGQVLLNTVSGTTFSNNAFYFPQDLRVEGNLTAQQIYTEYVSSSVIYESGSTKFGDTTDDVMSVTGSIRVLGGSISGSMTGMFSSSAQVDYNSITNKLSGVVSSSAQVQPLLPGGTVSSSGQFPGWVTSSTQVVYTSLQSIPGGIMSSSAQTVTNLIGQTVTLSGSQFASIVSGSGTAYRLVVPVGTNLYAT